jgi:hypothetical protein
MEKNWHKKRTDESKDRKTKKKKGNVKKETENCIECK